MESLALGFLLALPLVTSVLGEPRRRPNQGGDTCYSVTYDSIQPGVGVEILPKTLRRSPGVDRGRLVTDDTIPFWTRGYTWSSWRAWGDSLEFLLSEGQVELTIHVRVRGDTLRGRLSYRTDVGDEHWARVTAVRRSCLK